MNLARCIAVFALLAALPAAAQLHRCKDKSGKTTYQDQPCEEGTAVGKVQGAAPAGPSAPRKGLGLWETTMVLRPRQKTIPREEWDAAGMNGFFFGRPMKTVSCSEHPEWIVFHQCEKQVAAGGGVCRLDEQRDSGATTDRTVKVITGDFRARFHVEQSMTVEYKLEPTKWTDEVSVDHRYLGPCKPGMGGHTTFHVKDSGEWVTEAQLSQELERRAKEVDRLRNK